jgi:hypothetical protein
MQAPSPGMIDVGWIAYLYTSGKTNPISPLGSESPQEEQYHFGNKDFFTNRSYT